MAKLSSDNSVKAGACSSSQWLSQDQQAKSLELRAAMSLSRLLQQQGKRQEASDLLAPIYYGSGGV